MNLTDDGMNLDELIRQIVRELPPNCNRVDEPARCDERAFYVFLMGKGFLLVFLLAMFGNCINLLIYNSDQIRFYLAIRMLCTRLLMNSFAMLCLLPQALRTVGAWEPNSSFDLIYWAAYPYQAYFVNVFGFCAMWLTVLMTGECYLHVFFPSHSKSLCTKKNLSKSYFLIFICALLLALIYPLNRTATVSEDRCQRVVVSIAASEDEWMQLAERLHTVAHLLFAIVIPMAVLLFMTLSVVWKLLLRRSDFPHSSHFTSEKRCVTMITLITTSLQLLAELPPIPVFIYAAIIGPQVVNESAVCVWNTIGLFLGLCNMSLSFFVYLALSDKFRQMVYSRLRELSSRFMPCVPTVPKKVVGYSSAADRYANSRLLGNPHIQRKLVIESDLVSDNFLMTERSTISNPDDTYL